MFLYEPRIIIDAAVEELCRSIIDVGGFVEWSLPSTCGWNSPLASLRAQYRKVKIIKIKKTQSKSRSGLSLEKLSERRFNYSSKPISNPPCTMTVDVGTKKVFSHAREEEMQRKKREIVRSMVPFIILN